MHAIKYLQKCYDKAFSWTQKNESPNRLLIKGLINQIESSNWSGKTGVIDRLVYQAHLSIAYKAGVLKWVAASRTLAEMSGISSRTASRANIRLCKNGYLAIPEKAIGNLANIFELKNTSTQSVSLPQRGEGRKWDTLLIIRHDIFRYGALGKAAAEIWVTLNNQPATIKELTNITKRHTDTIKRAIKRMSKIVDSGTGEFLPMIASDDGKTWYALDSDLDKLALILGSAGKGRKQKEQHKEERRSHNLIFKNKE